LQAFARLKLKTALSFSRLIKTFPCKASVLDLFSLEVRIMRWLPSLFFCLVLFPIAAEAQGDIIKTVAGPNRGQFRILISLIPNTDENTWKMQSFILDINPIKKGQQPSSYFLDLTTTRRNLTTDEKKQKILDLRWGRSGDVEAQCQDGSWQKSNGPEIDKILDAARAVAQIAPVETSQAIEIQLPKDVTQKITDVLNGLETSKLPCVQDGGPN
jgi:hypothetical protein